MADDVAEEQPVRWEWRFALGILVLIFNGSIIWWNLLWGKSENLLHQNALSWAFIMSGGVLAGLGLGAIIPQLAQLVGKK